MSGIHPISLRPSEGHKDLLFKMTKIKEFMASVRGELTTMHAATRVVFGQYSDGRFHTSAYVSFGGILITAGLTDRIPVVIPPEFRRNHIDKAFDLFIEKDLVSKFDEVPTLNYYCYLYYFGSGKLYDWGQHCPCPCKRGKAEVDTGCLLQQKC
ncbi:hypothetical protein PHYBLDRAFT_73365 [Phycomyces blakesleeanus NRRL 1555(-)]|uniref:Uncharacterized protein n=1 Tax=Phycomyces blakesleeanus (strain ATCC 8743b / DSM 1359 / FGSC 10004 / NBRC 33097 / NRRL 1555) TaxID=763407 RepID=A0A162X5N7_PHYB8|nr:hypothetical protein PHYBLDRAFT_73365 [Phycomyces blakesleeanus NRRL 1555(-)]OAD72635.1 hypothetical protein PHYBLDRAFT_73365 [Phycomyces blakesleeanus NRRL 1555(-)]|eukprot:XP_018290675.1 hypothetical protein PHYBLDRAFT_73365 [Phycomyces blakesleeanus NRRL 1555(-)]